jgi:hypothetical protein
MKLIDTLNGEISQLVDDGNVPTDTAPTYADVRVSADQAERGFTAPASKKSSTPAAAPTYDGIKA